MLVCEECGLKFEVDPPPEKSVRFYCDKKDCDARFWVGSSAKGLVCGLDLKRSHGKESPVKLPPATSLKIIETVSGVFDMPSSIVVGASRKAEAFKPRAAVCLLLHNHFGMSYSQIARLMGGRDHTTILLAVRRAREMLDEDPTFAKRYRQAEAQIVA